MKTLNEIHPREIIDFIKKVDKKTWIQIGAVATFLLGLMIFVVWPAWFTRLEIRGKIKILENQIRMVETLSKKKAEWAKNKEEFGVLIEGAKKRLFEPGETAFLLGAVSKLAQESNVALIASQPKQYEGTFPAPFNDLYEGSLYDFTVEGKYHNIGALVSKIESNHKLLRVQLCHIRLSEEKPDVQITDLSLSAVSFKKGKP